jgi:WD40 repeat protein
LTDVLVIGSDTSQVVTLDIAKHEPMEISTIGDEIMCMDGFSFKTGAQLTVFGTRKGRILMKIDWDALPNDFEADGPINCVKITKDGLFMLVTSEAGSIFLFTKHNESYFNGAPKEYYLITRLKLELEIPVWISIAEDQRLVLVGTNLKQIYKIILPELNSRTLLQGLEQVDISALTAKYMMKPRLEEGKICSLFLGKDYWFNVLGDFHGFISVWSTKDELYGNYGTLLRGHSGRISSLYISKCQESLYTIGLFDETILHWKRRQNLKKLK